MLNFKEINSETSGRNVLSKSQSLVEDNLESGRHQDAKKDSIPDIYFHLLKRHVHLYPKDGSHKEWVCPQVVFLFSTGDISQVTDAVVRDLHHPIGRDLIASLLVEESIRDEVIKKIHDHLQLMDERLHKHPNYLQTMKIVERMNCSTIHIEEFPESVTKRQYRHIKPGSPIVVLDFPQYYFGDKPSGIVTLSTFRNLNEAAKLCTREGLHFVTASIWSAKLSQCFELVSRLHTLSHYTFNCLNLPFNFLVEFSQCNEMVIIIQNIRYEVHAINGKLKTIAFLIK